IAETAARGETVRVDDDPEVLKKRLAAYRAQTAPLVTYYTKKGALKTVDGMAAIPEVTAAIGNCLEGPANPPPGARRRKAGPKPSAGGKRRATRRTKRTADRARRSAAKAATKGSKAARSRPAGARRKRRKIIKKAGRKAFRRG